MLPHLARSHGGYIIGGFNLRYKKLSDAATTPRRSTSGSAGYDLFAITDVTILPHKTATVETGIAIAIDDNVVALIYARSGLSTKHGVTLVSGVGVVDSDYRGPITVPLINHSDTPYHVVKGDRIAQIVLTPILTPPLVEVLELNETDRGNGGYGSTGR